MKSRIVLLFLLLSGVVAQAQKVSFDGYKTVNGVKLYCKVIGEGEPILVIHGGPGYAHNYFLPYLKTLAKTNKVILYDQRSTGKSEIPKDSLGCSHKNMVDDIEGLRKAFGIQKLVIMAHGWASKLAVNYAFKYPSSLKTIIFVAPTPLNHQYDAYMQKYTTDHKYTSPYMPMKNKIINLTVSNQEVRMRLAFLSVMFVPENEEKVTLYFPPNWGDKQRALFKGLGSDNFKYDYDYYPVLSKIKANILLIHGDADAVPLEAEDKMLRSIGNGRLVRMGKSGHFPFIEEEQEFAKQVTAFMKDFK
jgi:proline iminopeptidase